MKTKQLHIQPRQSGKTTKIIEMFLNDLRQGKESIIIVPILFHKKHIFDQITEIIGHRPKKIMSKIKIRSVNSLKEDDFIGTTLDNVYIDEALFCNKYKLWEAYKNIFLFWDCNIIAYSTSDRLYSEELITLTKLLKFNPYLEKYIRVDTLEEIEEHYWENIITEDFEIITHKCLPEDKFRTECMGEFYETN